MKQSNPLIENDSHRSGPGRAERIGMHANANHSHLYPPPPESRGTGRPRHNLVALRKMGAAAVPRARPQNSSLVAFIGVLMRHRYPRRPSAMAAEIGVSKATAYRYIAEIERQSALPLARAEDPATGKIALVGVDWERMRSWR